MFVQFVRGVVAAAFIWMGAGAANAQFLNLGGTGGKWFVEGSVGASWGDYDGFSGLGVSSGVSNSGDTSLTAGAGLGLFLTNQLYAKVSYKYFGSFDALTGVSSVSKTISTDAHGLMLGLGFNVDLSRELFLEATGEFGVSFLHATGSDIFGFDIRSNTESNFAGGLGLGLGYRIAPNMDLLVMGNYYWLGDARTSTDIGSVSAKYLSVVSATVGARIKF